MDIYLFFNIITAFVSAECMAISEFFDACILEKSWLFFNSATPGLALSDYHLNSTQLYFRQTINNKELKSAALVWLGVKADILCPELVPVWSCTSMDRFLTDDELLVKYLRWLVPALTIYTGLETFTQKCGQKFLTASLSGSINASRRSSCSSCFVFIFFYFYVFRQQTVIRSLNFIQTLYIKVTRLFPAFEYCFSSRGLSLNRLILSCDLLQESYAIKVLYRPTFNNLFYTVCVYKQFVIMITMLLLIIIQWIICQRHKNAYKNF